jgi:hypothetical protein
MSLKDDPYGVVRESGDSQGGTRSPSPARSISQSADALLEEWKPPTGFSDAWRARVARFLSPIGDYGSFPVVLLEHGSGVVSELSTQFWLSVWLAAASSWSPQSSA